MKSIVRALALALLLAPAATVAAPPESGTYELRTMSAAAEQVVCVVKIDVKDGGASAELVAAPPVPQNLPDDLQDYYKLEVKGAAFDGNTLRVTVKQFATDQTFEGTPAADGKSVVGSFGSDSAVQRARL